MWFDTSLLVSMPTQSQHSGSVCVLLHGTGSHVIFTVSYYSLQCHHEDGILSFIVGLVSGFIVSISFVVLGALHIWSGFITKNEPALE